MLIGFLFALAILAPIYLAYFLAGLQAEIYQAFASIPLILFFYLFYQFARYRARRYRLTRTIWRGVRFWMKGSGWLYALQAGLWMLLIIITLGLAVPWAQAALERYKMRHSFYGDLAGGFDGTGGGLVQAGVDVVACDGAHDRLRPSSWQRSLPSAAVLVGVLAVVAFPFIYAVYKAIEWRWWVSGIRFGDVRFESKLASGALVRAPTGR